MKKLVLLLIIFVAAQQVIASGFTVANNWRWKSDVGNLDATNFIAPVNTTPTISLPGAVRLRMSTYVSAAYTSTTDDHLVLQYRVEPQANSDGNISPTQGLWRNVMVQDSSTTTEPFVINPGYVGPLADRSNSSAALICKPSGSNNLHANDEQLPTFPAPTFQRAIGLSRTNDASSANQFINAGFYENEYRLVFTKNAVPGQVYYFRLSNSKTIGTGAGTVDAWDYSAGFPSIVVSPSYNGTIDPALPDLRATLIGGTGAFTTGVSKTGTLRITNGGTVATQGTIKTNISVPNGWAFSIPTPPAGWSYSSGVLTNSSAILGPGSVQNFSFTMVNSTAGYAAGLLQAVIDRTVTIDGNGANNSATALCSKQL